MPNANQLFQHLFPGTGYPSFSTEWPNFTFVDGNPSGWSRPVVDGFNHGIGSRTYSPTVTGKAWRARSNYYPGRLNYKLDLDCRFKNPESGTGQIGIILRFIDYDNLIVARLKVGGAGGTPTLKIYKRIGGVETQIGSTYSGFSNTTLFSRLLLRARIEDTASGTRVTCYKDSTVSDNGTVIIDVTDPALTLFGAAYTAGLEITNLFNDEVYITSLTCYDFADEWNPSGNTDPGDNWKVEFGDTMYSLTDLAALTPSIKLMEVKQAFGANGNECTFEVIGDFRTSQVIYPGQSCRVFHNGDCRFNGTIAEGDQSATSKQEVQHFRGRDAQWASRQVIIAEDDNTGTMYFNVYATSVAGTGACSEVIGDDVPDEYNPDRQNMTIGAIIQFLFDRYLNTNEGLRFYGAAPQSGNATVTAEISALDAVIPDLHVSGNFLTAIQQLLKYMPKYQAYVDPETKIWHFFDVTSLTAETIALQEDTATSIKVKPDPDRSYTAVLWRGAKPKDKDPVVLSISDGTVSPASTQDQIDNSSSEKEHRSSILITITGSGTLTNFTVNGKLFLALDYVDIDLDQATQFNVQTDDWRGSVIQLDGVSRIVIGNTSTRFYLSAPNWSVPPVNGSTANITYADACAQEALSAMGVGRGFKLTRPGSICGIADTHGGALSALNGLKNKGRCGSATVVAKGIDGITYAQQYEYQLKMLTDAQQEAFGICDPLLLLSKPALIPIGLVNFFGPKGSAPSPRCTSTSKALSGLDLQVAISEVESTAAIQRYPTIGYHGPAFSTDPAQWDGAGNPLPGDWRNRNVLIVDDPEFRDVSLQGPGILKAQQAIIALFGQKAYTVTVEIVSCWNADRTNLTGALTSRFANLQKKLRISSTKRTTGLESNDDLPIFEVVYDVANNKTTLTAGNPIIWAGIDPKTIASNFVDKNLLKKVYAKMKEVEDYRNQLLAHNADRAGSQAAWTDGCSVSISDPINKRQTNATTEFRNKDTKIGALKALDNLSRSLMTGTNSDHPGNPVSVPGLSESDAQMPVRSAAVLESLAKYNVFDQGPVSGSKVNGDRSRFGGLIGADNTDATAAPEELLRTGGYAFRRAPDASGSVHGGSTFQFSELDSDGVPTAWQAFDGPISFPNQHVPLSFITVGTILDTLLSRIKTVEKTLGLVPDPSTEQMVSPGDITNEYPDGAPADLLTTAIAMTKFEGSQLLGSTILDPGGPVFSGSKSNAGLDSQSFWRVAMPENVIEQVEYVGSPDGTNGGNYAPVTVDSASVFADSMKIEHKQIHGPEMAADASAATTASATAAADDSPFAFGSQVGMVLSGTPAAVTGAGAIIPLPTGAHGVPVVTALLKEESHTPAGQIYSVCVAYSYKQSPWTTIATTSYAPSLVADGVGGATGQYKAPIGSVPAGIRLPSDTPTGLGVSVQRTGATGTDTAANRGMIVIGIGVDLAVCDGGIWIRIRQQGTAVEDVLVHNHPQQIEAADSQERWRLELGKGIFEIPGVSESWCIELNPPTALNENPAADDACVRTVTKALTVGAGAADSTVLQLN